MKNIRLAVLAAISLIVTAPTIQAQGDRAQCPRHYIDLRSDYQTLDMGRILSETEINSCLKSINDLEVWKSFWGVDEDYPLFLVSLEGASTGGDRKITMLIRDVKVSAHWSTLAGMGYVSPVSGETPVYINGLLVRRMDFSKKGSANGLTKEAREAPLSVVLNHLGKAAKEFQLCPEEYVESREKKSVYPEYHSIDKEVETQEKCKGSRYEDRWAFAADFVKAAKTEVEREEAALKIRQQAAELEYQKTLQEIRSKTQLDKMSLPEKEALNKSLDEKKSAAKSAGGEPYELRENRENIYKVENLLGALRLVDKKYTVLLGQKLGTKPVARADGKLFPMAAIDYDGRKHSHP